MAGVCVELTAVGQEKATGLCPQIWRVAVLHPPVEQGRSVAVAESGRFVLEEVCDFGIKDIPGKRQVCQGHVEIITASPRIRGGQRVAGLQESVKTERVAPVLATDEKPLVIHIFRSKALLPRSSRITRINSARGPFLLLCFQLSHTAFQGLHDLVLCGELPA